MPSSVREKLEEKFNVKGLGDLIVMKADGTIVTEDGNGDIWSGYSWSVEEGKEIDLIKEWKEYDETKSNQFCEIIKESILIKADESKKPIDEILAGKCIVLLYFSASWCRPCSILKKFYQDNFGKGVELIFISDDFDKKDMLDCMKESHGNWYACDHSSRVGERLKKKFCPFRIPTIPTLVALKPDGTIINGNATDDIKNNLSIVDEWKSMQNN